MCTYTTHIRVCARCTGEDTVLISEQLCLVAKASGVFGSCLEGVLGQRDATGYQCWQCKESSVVRMPTSSVHGHGAQGGFAGRRRRGLGGVGMGTRKGGVSVGVGGGYLKGM
ncbi:hypothetical protein C8A00DRAFT_11456 [Chaetomidium leptoderma]|uniref:Uncharacterized protein n=1 Tax=Chaetomidium leptoderma TaxID=669021 RepID=A0AAN6VUJ6_9PEZI|nr:hypothetical protein C8A00DRAFT_11456 [Chaetomidium leptoderma]